MFNYLWIVILAVIYLIFLVLSVKDIKQTWKLFRSISCLEPSTIAFIAFHIVFLFVISFVNFFFHII